MNIRQLKSGSWNVRKTVNGVTHSYTFDHKPTKREIELAFADAITTKQSAAIKGTFKELAYDFIESRRNTYSPSTINSYKSIMRNLQPSFLNTKLAEIDQITIQKEINTYAKTRSPKSVKNASGFITVVMWNYRPDMTIHLKLPQKEKVETYIPTDAEVEKILEAVKGSPYEIAIWLAVCGMRKSEIIAVTSEDLNGNMLTINKAKVINDEHEYVEKTTKTTSSTRTIWIPDYVADLIKRKGSAYDGFPGNILRDLHRVQDRLGINRCKLHALRHYYVSHAHSCGIPDAYIAEAVGHASINTTRNIYLQAQQDKSIEMQKKAMSSLF